MIVDGERLFVGPPDSTVEHAVSPRPAADAMGVDIDLGRQVRYRLLGVGAPGLIVRDGIAYTIGGRSGGRSAVRVGGKGDATETNVVWSFSGGSYVPSPVLHEGRLYWIDDRGIAHCIDAKTGAEVAKKRIGGQFYASVVLIGERLYVVSRFDGTYVLQATPEFTQVAHNRLSDESDFSGSPAVSDGQLILRSDKCLYCIEGE